MSSATIVANSIAPIRRLLQISVGVLIALSGTIFACAEGAPLAALAVPVAWIGVAFVDGNRAFRVKGWSANLLGLVVVVAVVVEFFGESVEASLLSFGHFLCYLSWVLMLQEKQTRQFWWLCALSVLQVATAAVLTNSPWLGLALLAYMLAALFTLSVFSLYRAASRTAITERHAEAPRNGRFPDASPGRSTVRAQTSSRWLTSRFMAGAAINSLLSLVLGLAIFIFTPRIWIGQLETIAGQPLPSARMVSGAGEDVKLGDIGQIMENTDLVMEVQFNDPRTGDIISFERFLEVTGGDDPLFRGVVLDDYHQGRWTPSDNASMSWTFSQAGLGRYRGTAAPFYQQYIRLRPTGSSTLYVANGTIACTARRGREPIARELLRNVFHRDASDESLEGETFEYYAYSAAANQLSSPGRGAFRQDRYLRRMTSIGENLQPLRDLALKLTSSPDGNRLPEADAVRRLLFWLRDSGEFRYSLNASIDDPTVDPVVDFVVNRKEGHCEYYASALALALRSLDIPSRLIRGFKGGTLNERSGYYEVRQLHAHAWVEAYVDDDWIVLDPTPAERDQNVAARSATSHRWTDFINRVGDLWRSGMLMTGTQQRQMLLNPLRRSTRELFHSFAEFGADWDSEGSSGSDTGAANWAFVWTGLFLVVLVGILIGMVRFGSRHVRFPFRKRSRRDQKNGRLVGPPVPFYERFCGILAREGYVRNATQTQREFSDALRSKWSARAAETPLGEISELITAAFYRVRFGNQTLPSSDLDSINSSLDRLEQALSTAPSGNGAVH